MKNRVPHCMQRNGSMRALSKYSRRLRLWERRRADERHTGQATRVVNRQCRSRARLEAKTRFLRRRSSAADSTLAWTDITR
jgi:hypothetical protein